VRIRLTGIRLPSKLVHRPDVTATAPQRLADLSWSGFEASLDPRKLRTAGRWRPGVWELFVVVRTGKVHRRRGRFFFNRLRPIRGVEIPLPDGVMAKAVPTGGGGVQIDVRTQWNNVTGHRLDGDVLELTGEAHGTQGEKPRLELIRRADEKKFRYPLKTQGEGSPAKFSARVKLKDLLESGHAAAGDDEVEDAGEEPDAEEVEDRQVWDIEAVGGGPRRTVGLVPDAAAAVWTGDGRELALSQTRKADAALVEQAPRPVVLSAAWNDEGKLQLEGELPPGSGAQEVLLVARDYGDTWAFPAVASGTRFSALLEPAHTRSLAGTLPLREGKWDLYARAAGGGESAPRVPIVIASSLYEALPLTAVVDRKPFALTMARNDRALMVVDRNLEDDESGQYNQRRLRETVYVARRHEPLRDAVIYTSFNGRQYSDSPRAIHEELVRRGAPLEHLWVVADGQCEVPPSAQVVREGSREWHEALGNARYVVSNDHFPSWFKRRPDQVCLQTWHGVPLKRLGFDVISRRQQLNRFIEWDEQLDNWQYVISPGAFSTPILKRAYAIEGEMLETGYPRDDVLARPERDELSREVRRRLGIPEGKRTVLYAPTYRDHVFDQRGRYRLDLRIDLERLRAAVGDDTVILFRKHHYIVDPVPADPHGFVRDVSRYPDGTELMLAADVLVTDYSSMMFDYANTGRPMLFYTYDLDAYGDEIRGFYVDYVDTVPGPLLRTTDELADALRDIDGVRSSWAARYDEFTKRFCELDDGHASERVVDRLFVE
jgi:CDP-glycerol glycerophosphotransferase